MLTVPVSAVDPKDNWAASAFQHSLAGFDLEPCCQDAGAPSAAGRMSAIPTTIPQPGGQGQVLEGAEVCGSQLHG